jgi:hypothetical protein
MGTRSTIALEFADGTVQQVYCHWDGYLAHNGQILAKHYSNPFILRDLIDLGDVSSLKPSVGIEHAFSHFGTEMKQEEYDALYGEMTTFYGRDRGEEGTGAKKFASYEDYVANHQYEEYEYILRNIDGKAVWFVADHDNVYIELEQAFIDEQDRIAQEEMA